jgi:hypothetical protein
MKFRKYEFTEAQWNTQRANIENEIDGQKYWNTELTASVVELGYLNESPKYSVDIIWQDDEVSSFAAYKVWPVPIGSHSFGYDIDKEYSDEYYKL